MKIMSQQIPYQSATKCPFCGKHDHRPVTFTWWGGLLGPKLFHHVQCNQCRKTFNGKTGQSNAVAIAIYLVVSGVLVIGLLILLVIFRLS